MTGEDRPDPAGRLVDGIGQPIRRPDGRCPRCRAEPARRVASGGFGRAVHDVCGSCGYEFAERTPARPATGDL